MRQAAVRFIGTAVKGITYAAFFIGLAAGRVPVASAATLSTNFAEVYVDDLKIGGSYNLTEVANFPMWVNYGGDTSMDVTLSVVLPTAGELKSGYEPVPDASWLTISKTNATLYPDESMNIDVTINIPNDEKYLGKKYQAYVMVSSVPPKSNTTALAVALGLKGRVLISVAPKAPTEAELKAMKKKRQPAFGVIINPEKFAAEAEPGMPKIDVTGDMPLKLINSSKENVTITLEAVEPLPNGTPVPKSYTQGDPKELALSRKKVTLKSDVIENVQIRINRGVKEAERLFYLVKLTIKSPTTELIKYVRVYVN